MTDKIVRRIERLIDRLDKLAYMNTERAALDPDNVLADYRNGKAAAYNKSKRLILEELGDILEALQEAEEMEGQIR